VRSDQSSNWRAAFTAAGAVVAVVATLLLAITAVARSIREHASQILGIADEIVERTNPIWKLEQINHEAALLQADAPSIAKHAGEIADALESAASSEGRGT
jgi:hypothetical protein